MNKQDLIEIYAREAIPTSYLKRIVSSDTFKTIVIPLFLKAFNEKDVYLTFQPSQRHYSMAIEHKSASDAYIDALILFYDENEAKTDEYDLRGAIHEALYDLHTYIYRRVERLNEAEAI